MDPIAGNLALAPLGAGDLIDRAVRLYRRHFLTLIRIAAPPVVISAAGSTLTTIAFRAIGATPSSSRLLLYLLVAFGGSIVIGAGSLFSLIVMGGATRNLVAHLLWDEPVSFRSTYRAVKSRFWGLLGASILVAIWLAFCAWLSFMAFYFVFALLVLLGVAIAQIMPSFVIAILSVLGSIVALGVAQWG